MATNSLEQQKDSYHDLWKKERHEDERKEDEASDDDERGDEDEEDDAGKTHTVFLLILEAKTGMKRMQIQRKKEGMKRTMINA